MAANVLVKQDESGPQGDVDLYAGVDEFGSAANPVCSKTIGTLAIPHGLHAYSFRPQRNVVFRKLSLSAHKLRFGRRAG